MTASLQEAVCSQFCEALSFAARDISKNAHFQKHRRHEVSNAGRGKVSMRTPKNVLIVPTLGLFPCNLQARPRWPYVCHGKRACMHISRDSSLPHHLLQLTSQAMVLQDQLLCSALWYPKGRLAGPRTLEGPDRLYYIQTLEVLRHTCFAVVNPSLA